MTEEQGELVSQLASLLEKIEKSGVTLVYDRADDTITAFNTLSGWLDISEDKEAFANKLDWENGRVVSYGMLVDTNYEALFVRDYD